MIYRNPTHPRGHSAPAPAIRRRLSGYWSERGWGPIESLEPRRLLSTSASGLYLSPTSYATGVHAHGVTAADLNGDGKTDLAIANAGSNTVTVMLGNGDGTFQPPVSYATGGEPKSVHVADLNGDGRLDLICACQTTGQVSVLMNEGNGVFAPAVNYVGPAGSHDAIAGDFNGDGHPDIAVVGHHDTVVSILINRGDGTFTAGASYQVGSGSSPHSVVTGDFNHDGKLDLAVADYSSNQVAILMGNGDGTFQAATLLPAGQGPHEIVVGDFNHDGNLDLATANEYSNDVSVFLGTGNGSFAPAVEYAAGTAPKGIAVGDVNKDGAQDLVVADSGGNYPDGDNTSGMQISVLPGNGDGTFGAAAPYAAGHTPFGVALGDFSNDGALDVATANWHSNDVTVLKNVLGRTASSADVSGYRSGSGVGVQQNETVLTPQNVNTATFGKKFNASVDGLVYAEPVFANNVNISVGQSPGTHNVVYVATEHDSVYAIDSTTGSVLWHTSFLDPNTNPIPSADTGNTADISTEIGITSTPVIDPATGALYVAAATKQVINGQNHAFLTLHALDLGTGAEHFGQPAIVGDTIYDPTNTNYTYVSGPSVQGNGYDAVGGRVYFNALNGLDRPALSLVNGTVYIAISSHGDTNTYHGWVLGYSASTLASASVFCTTPNGQEGSIWMSGGQMAYDTAGNLYLETGNGTFDTTLDGNGFPSQGDYGDSFIKLSPDPTSTAINQNGNLNGWGLKAADYFTPSNQADLDVNDTDLGSGAPVLLPDSAGTEAHPHLLVGAGKEGKIYLLDVNNMGHFDPTADHVVQEIPNALRGSFDTPAVFNNTLYYVGARNSDGGQGQDPLAAFAITPGNINPTPTQNADLFMYPGSTPVVSSNGASGGVLWALDHGSNQLRAFDASNVATELWTSDQAPAGRDQLGTEVKFSVPTVADGSVFVGVDHGLVSYGLLAPGGSPTIAQPAAAGALTNGFRSVPLGALGASDQGEAGLLYTWSVIGAAPAAVTFTANGSNAAKATVANLTTAGDYTFRVTVSNAGGLFATSDVMVTVNQRAAGLAVSPPNATLADGATQQFTVTGNDQFNHPIVAGGAAWSVVSGLGSIDSSGLFTAPSSGAGSATIAATLPSGQTAAAGLTVTDPPPPVVPTQIAPVVTSQPLSQTVQAGTAVMFTAAASGTPAPAVQWQLSSGGGAFTAIAGATATILSLTASATDNGNQYRAVFTNAAGSATTSPATLVVNSNGGVQPQTGLLGSLGGTLPAAVVVGSETAVSQSVTLTNQTGQAVKGLVRVTFFISKGQTLDGSAIQIGSPFKARVDLKVNAAKAVRERLKKFPTVTPGQYYLLAEVTHGSGSNVVASASPIRFAAPAIDLTAVVTPQPRTVRAGRTAAVTVRVFNGGNSPARGKLSIAFSASATSLAADARSMTTLRRAIDIKAGASALLQYELPVHLAAGAYHLVADLDPANVFHESDLNNKLAISAGLLTVL